MESLTTTVETPLPSTARGDGEGDGAEGAEGADGARAVTPGGAARHGHLSPDNARRRAMALDHLLNGLKASGKEKEEKEEGDGRKKGSGLLDVPVVRHAVELLAV